MPIIQPVCPWCYQRFFIEVDEEPEPDIDIACGNCYARLIKPMLTDDAEVYKYTHDNVI